MVALPLALLLCQSTPVIESRTVPFPNGARLISTRVSNASTVLVELWLNSRELMDRPGSDGWRHMLEHLVLGQAAAMEDRLERRGYFLEATTFATSMRIRLEVPRTDLDLAVAVMRTIAQPLNVTPEALAKERAILSHERALEGSADRALARAVDQLTRSGRRIPMGSSLALDALTPQSVTELQRHQFAPTRTLLLMTGDVDHATTERLGSALLSAWRFGNPPTPIAFPEAPTSEPKIEFQGAALGLMLPLIDPVMVAQHQAAGQILAQSIRGAEFRRSTGVSEVVMTLWVPSADIARDRLQQLSTGSVGPQIQALLTTPPPRSLEAISANLAARTMDPTTVDVAQLWKNPEIGLVDGIEQAIRAWKSAAPIGGDR